MDERLVGRLARQRRDQERRESTLRFFTLPKLQQAALGALSVDMPERQAQQVASEIAETLLTHLITCVGWVDSGQWRGLQRKRRRAK